LAAVDLDGDGDLDLAMVDSHDFPLDDHGRRWATFASVLLNHGDGTFAPCVDYSIGARPGALVAADLNGDGKPDLAVPSQRRDVVSVLLNRGDGTFASKIDFPVGREPKGIAAADLDGDGRIDLVVGNTKWKESSLSLLFNTGGR
jgi:hypothetical protein